MRGGLQESGGGWRVVKVLHVLPRLAPGGMERLVIQLAEDAARRGDLVAVASAPGAWVTRVVQAGAEYVPLPASSRGGVFRMAAATARLAGCMSRLRPGIVHAHNARATTLAWLALAATRHDGVLIPTLHGVHPRDYRATSQILRRIAPRVITCAPSVGRSLEAAGFPGERIDVITNGAALNPASSERQAELRRHLRLGPEPLVVGMGRLVAQKDWPTFVAAASRVDGPSFVVAGDGPLRHELADLARRSGDRVRFVGSVDDVSALVGLAECVVSTSIWEGLPLALLEALSLGARVVATAIGGVPDVVPADAVVLVPPKDPRAVADAISRILTDAGFAETLRQRAEAASVAWRPEQMLTLYRNAYQAASSGKPRWV
jgi:glycosyltransferase involved in cell wall biosynthesis